MTTIYSTFKGLSEYFAGVECVHNGTRYTDPGDLPIEIGALPMDQAQYEQVPTFEEPDEWPEPETWPTNI